MIKRFSFLLICLVLVSCDNSKPEVEGFSPSDEDIIRAYEDARASIGEFIEGLENKVDGNRYLIKFRVEADGEVEHMWAESITYSNDKFTGILINEPAKINSISVGASLESPIEEISDWAILSSDDEFLAGGFTIKVMSSKEGKKPD